MVEQRTGRHGDDAAIREEILEHFSPDYHPLVSLGQQLGADTLTAVLDALSGTQLKELPESRHFWSRLQRALYAEQIEQRLAAKMENGLGRLAAIDEIAAEAGVSRRQIWRWLRGDYH